MGIQYLNTYLKRNCSKAISYVSLNDLNQKKLAIDASIYMYRFKSEGFLIDGIYQMAMMMRRNNITPVFVFDGKPPKEKRALLLKRRQEKERAKQELMALTELTRPTSVDVKNMKLCKQKCVKLSRNDIAEVKKLLLLCGITCYQANGEADELCAKLVLKNRVWACVSEDTDLFVYGCPRVLRGFSMFQGSFMVYEMDKILQSLNLTLKEFREVCVLSGTDYNTNTTKKVSLNMAMKTFSKYKEDKTNPCDFYEWLENSGYQNYNCYLLYSNDIMFDTRDVSISDYDKRNPIVNKQIEQTKLRLFLKDYGFIFV